MTRFLMSFPRSFPSHPFDQLNQFHLDAHVVCPMSPSPAPCQGLHGGQRPLLESPRPGMSHTHPRIITEKNRDGKEIIVLSLLPMPLPAQSRAAPSPKSLVGEVGRKVNNPFAKTPPHTPQKTEWNKLAGLKGPIWETTQGFQDLTPWQLGGHQGNQGNTGGKSSVHPVSVHLRGNFSRKPGWGPGSRSAHTQPV